MRRLIQENLQLHQCLLRYAALCGKRTAAATCQLLAYFPDLALFPPFVLPQLWHACYTVFPSAELKSAGQECLGGRMGQSVIGRADANRRVEPGGTSKDERRGTIWSATASAWHTRVRPKTQRWARQRIAANARPRIVRPSAVVLPYLGFLQTDTVAGTGQSERAAASSCADSRHQHSSQQERQPEHFCPWPRACAGRCTCCSCMPPPEHKDDGVAAQEHLAAQAAVWAGPGGSGRHASWSGMWGQHTGAGKEAGAFPGRTVGRGSSDGMPCIDI